MIPRPTSRHLAAAAFAAALGWVFAVQPHDDGFAQGHRGWVSAHTLAIAQKASPENGLVGYAVSLATPASRDLFYFDRYPVFFSAALHAAQRLVAPDKSAEIRIARQAMNLVYALTLVMGAALLVELGVAFELAIAAAALAGAGTTMVEFRDMVHFDQPALLGIVLLLWAMARRASRRGGSALVLAMTAVAVLSGRGYASFAVLGLWWIFDALGRFGVRGGSGPGQWLRDVATGLPTRACVLGIALAAACLSYNVAVEARVRDVALSESSIVVSARQRLSLDEGFNDRKSKRLTWGRFLTSQQANFARSALPWTSGDPVNHRRGLQATIVAVVLAGALSLAVTRGGSLRTVALVACACGPLWLVAMRNLAAFHPYTAMYLFPVLLLFFAAVVRAILAAIPPGLARRFGPAAAVAACLVLALSNHARSRDVARDGRGAALDTRDMQRIAGVLEPREAVATDRQLFQGVPFALGFYLPDHDILVEGPASVVLSRRPSFPGENLTPQNARIFAFRPARTWHARSSLARLHPDSAAAESRRRRQARRGDGER